MKNNKILKIMVIGLIVYLLMLADSLMHSVAHAEYIDRAHKTYIYFAPGIDIFPDKKVDGKMVSGLGGVRYEKPIMAPASYVPNEPFTVAKLASVWARILELKPNPGAPVPKDVRKGTWYYGAFERLSKTHILDYLVDKNGNINPNRQLYVYEVFRSIKYYWDYSGFSQIKDEATGFIEDNYGPQSKMLAMLNKRREGFKRFKTRPWYSDVAEVVGTGFVYGMMSGSEFAHVEAKATNAKAMMLFCFFTGRSRWLLAPGYQDDIKIKSGYKISTDYERSALQSRPHGFIN